MYGIDSLEMVIGQGFSDSHCRLGLTHPHTFSNTIFENIILLLFCCSFFLILLRD